MLGIVVESNLALSLLCVGGGATVATANLVRQRARRAGLARRLAEIDVNLPLDTGHLSPALADLTCQARTLRLCLATPLQRMPEGTWRDTPWRRRQRCDEYDRALVDARRALWDWITCARDLSGADRALLRRLGLNLRAVQRALFAPGVLERTSDPWEAVLYPTTPDYDRVSDGLCEAMQDLQRFEVALLSLRAHPYR